MLCGWLWWRGCITWVTLGERVRYVGHCRVIVCTMWAGVLYMGHRMRRGFITWVSMGKGCVMWVIVGHCVYYVGRGALHGSYRMRRGFITWVM